MAKAMTENNAAVTNVVTLEHGNSSASGLVLPAQSADSSILIQCLKDILAKDTAGTNYNRELREVAHRLSIALETPGDTVQRIAYYPLHTSVVRIAINLNLFTILVNSDEPKTGKELAKITGVDHLLLLRLLRYLASVNAISEEGIDVYAANNVSKSMATPNLAAGVKHTFDTNGFAYMALPKFLEQTKYQNPSSSTNSAFHLAFNTKEPLWEWFPSHPEYHESFNMWMSGQREGRANWLDFFPLEQRLSKGFNMINDEVMLVDVGGGFGHEIQAIKEKFPHVPGRMILQDLPSTIAKALSVKGMETMAYDFFTPQPIKGARAYYLRNILHDWPDDKCKQILANVVAAMDRDHSKVILNELVIPDKGANQLTAQLDLTMMAVLSAMERTERQWHELLGSVGLKITNIWTDTPEAESIIEAVWK